MDHATKQRQRGAGTLVLTMLLLFGTSIALFYLNRGLVFEQKTSANQIRATTALEVAEAGIEWATGMLNTPYTIQANCGFDTTTTNSFRSKYVQTQLTAPTNPTANLVPATNVFPGCKITGTNTLSCNCPAVPASNTTMAYADLGTSVAPGFTVQFAAVDTTSVKVTSRGCTATASTCNTANASTADATAVIEVILKLRPVIRAVPAAPLSAGGTVDLSGSYNIINSDVATGGILVNAGSTIDYGNGVSLSPIAGVPQDNALVGSDSSLSSLATADPTCTNSTVFNAYFGSTMAQYQAEPTTKTLACSSSADCKSKLQAAYDDGWRSFYFSTDLHLSGNDTYGSVVQPVTIVTPNAITINGGITIYGLVFSNSSDWNDLGTGSANIHGAEVTCNNVSINGNGTVTYDPDALKNLGKINADLVRVPGSWREL